MAHEQFSKYRPSIFQATSASFGCGERSPQPILAHRQRHLQARPALDPVATPFHARHSR